KRKTGAVLTGCAGKPGEQRNSLYSNTALAPAAYPKATTSASEIGNARTIERMRPATPLDASDAYLVEGELSRLDRHREPVLARRQRTAPRVVVRAVRAIGAVEVALEAVVAERLRLEVASG